MKICIDADGCPVVDLTQEIAKEYNLDVKIFCDSSHNFESKDSEVIMVMKGQDAVDFELIKYIENGDIIITQDYGLAAMCLAKGGQVINQNGLIYNNDNIEQLLHSRHLNSKIRKSGGRVKGPKKRTKSDNDAFEYAFRKLIQLGEMKNA